MFGNNYPTIDGTGVRDYVHVVDLINGHLAALKTIGSSGAGVNVWNLGTGKGTSVFEMISAFEKVSGKQVPYAVKERRPGDVAECWASVEKANRELSWIPEFNLEQMVLDSWNWQTRNPEGYSALGT